MKKKNPYRRRLYALVAAILCLCFIFCIAGMTGLNARVIKKTYAAQLDKLEAGTIRKMKMIERSSLTEEEQAYQVALQISQISDSTNLGDIGIYYDCESYGETTMESGNYVFLHYYSSEPDQDGDLVYEETSQQILALDTYVSSIELEDLQEIYEKTEDSVLYVEGSSDEMYVVPTLIQVLVPKTQEQESVWSSRVGNHILADQDNLEYTVAWEKKLDVKGQKGKPLPEEVTVESEAYFLGNGEVTALAKERASTGKTIKKNNVFEVTRTGVCSVGDGEKVTYSYTMSPLKKAVSQLWAVYISLVIFYILAAVILYTVLRFIFAKQDQMDWSQKMLTRAIAHELKTPISIIQGYCEGLRVQEDRERQKEYVQTITQETKEMDRLVLDMLELSRLETNGYHMEPEEIALGELVRAVIKQYENAYEEKKVTVVMEEPEEILFMGDLSCMHKVVSNLVSNAIKHAPEHGTVKVTIERKREKVYFRVFNNGPEIEEEQRKQIWDGYHQVRKENKEKIRSTGLGLTIVKYMLDMHGFSYGCDNKHPGVEFWVAIR